MRTIELHLDMDEGDLLDASEEILQLVEGDPELCPPLRHLLVAIDDAITDALVEAPRIAPKPTI
jgi:hypothetical protein